MTAYVLGMLERLKGWLTEHLLRAALIGFTDAELDLVRELRGRDRKPQGTSMALPPSFERSRDMMKAAEMTTVQQEKRKVKFTYTDGLKVRQLPDSGLFTVKLPIQVQCAAERSVAVKLGVSCAWPTMAIPVKTLSGFGFEVDVVKQLRDAGEPVEVVLKNKLNRANSLSAGESVLRLFVLDNSSVEAEG